MPFVDADRGVADVSAALDGARQVLMERFAEDAELVGELRDDLWSRGMLLARVQEGKAEAGGKFADYFDYREALAHMWGSEPAGWSDDLKGHARMRVIVNAMTRMRFCSAGGEMEFKAKGDPGNAPPGYWPWFQVPGRASADRVLVTGHWSALGLKILPNLLALDSGCLWGRHLSALRLEDRRLFQVSCRPGDAAV